MALHHIRWNNVPPHPPYGQTRNGQGLPATARRWIRDDGLYSNRLRAPAPDFEVQVLKIGALGGPKVFLMYTFGVVGSSPKPSVCS